MLMCSQTHHLKKTFIPHMKGGSRATSCLKKSLDRALCVRAALHLCMSLLKLAEFVARRWLSDRAREAEWQGGISIWNFNKDEERGDASRHAVV